MPIRKSLLTVASSLVDLGRTRFELLVLEATNEKSRMLRLLGYSVAAILFLTLALLVFSILVAVYFWPTDSRYVALAVLAGVYLVLGLIFVGVARRILSFDPPPFAATLEELGRDAQVFERIRAAAQAEEEAEAAAREARRRQWQES